MTATPAHIRELVESAKGKADADLQPFADSANLIVSEDLATSGLSANRKILIEKYLAAHFAVLSLDRGGLTRETIGKSTDEYRGTSRFDSGLRSTQFGQTAIGLDTSGILSNLSGSDKKAGFELVGVGESNRVIAS